MSNIHYNHKDIEAKLYQFWLDNKLFALTPKAKGKKIFSIILPPPNVTGQLHLGHAWDGALQDTIIRYKKLRGFRTIWIPGTDHAGIATQTKYERILREQGVEPRSLSNEVFLERLLTWSKQQAQYIHSQWARLGFALDYDDEVFTLDENVKQLVNTSFANLYKQGLIYQDYKLVNWDVKLMTAISDIEVVRKPTNSKLYYFKYLLQGSNEFLSVATTRPETMFVDTCLFVNPKDKRYTKYIGKAVINPINNKPLTIMADTYIDPKFGTGVMKCTPAHDFNDYQLALKHQIKDYQSVINPDGTLNEFAKSLHHDYQGQDRIIARQQIVTDMQQDDLLIKVEDHVSEIGYSERTNEIVEPLLSKQWFIKMTPIVKEVTALLKKQIVNYVPTRFNKVMMRWLNNMNDWCISRQLLWGHRIPVWTNKTTGKLVVGKQPIPSHEWTQDKDVLDTWYSSGLWPVALTLNAQNANLSDFYPVSMLVTGYDIIFFWVARMFFQCAHLTKHIPIKTVFLHGLILDEQGRKMSKSLGNGVNPMQVIDNYGADALRVFLTSTASVGEDLCFSNEKIKYYASFVNKLWNAHNLLIRYPTCTRVLGKMHIFDQWIINEFNNVLKNVTKHMDKYNFVMANKIFIEFVWETFCNKYLEIIKSRLDETSTQYICNALFKYILIMLHPHMPFVSEQIYQELYKTKKSILLEQWPTLVKTTKFDIKLMEAFMCVYNFARGMRIEFGIKNSASIDIDLITKNKLDTTYLNELLIPFNVKIGYISKTAINPKADIKTYDNLAIEYINQYEKPEEIKKSLQKELNYLTNELSRSKAILANINFISKAPKQKVDLEKKKLLEYEQRYNEIKKALDNIN